MTTYKKLLLAVAVGSLALSALVTPMQVRADDEQCLYVYSVAEDIMKNRQAGVSLPKMMVDANGDAGRIALVKEAFSMYSIMNMQENKDEYVQKFAEWSYNQCDKHK